MKGALKVDIGHRLMNEYQKATKEEMQKKYPYSRGFPHVIIDGDEVGGLVPTAKFLVRKGLVSAETK